MKHMIQIQVTPEAGRELATRPGGPAPVIGRLLERFKPETVYMSPARQEMFLVCDLTPGDMAELMLAGCAISGQHPVFTAVIPGKDFGATVAKALPAAMALVEG
jgi:hypothetical protein